jgi:hypothetical protein
LNVEKKSIKTEKLIWEVITMLIFCLPFGLFIPLLSVPIIAYAITFGGVIITPLNMAIIFAILF